MSVCAPLDKVRSHSAAARWAPLRGFIALEARLGRLAESHSVTAACYEFLRFGVKQGWACLFGGIMIGLLIATAYIYPAHALLYRYDFLFLAALAVQAALLATGLETLEEAKAIVLFHVVGTGMEMFKTSIGSWIYPGASFFHLGGVPLFTGFMYAAIGSYLSRAWRLFHFRFTRHPPRITLLALSGAIYVNFFAHHFIWDCRIVLFAVAAAMFGRTFIHFRVWRRYRSMPLLVGFGLVALFIWFAENIGTFTHTWLYPNQLRGWSLVTFGKLSSWYLLLIISYTLVALINRPRRLDAHERVEPASQPGLPPREPVSPTASPSC